MQNTGLPRSGWRISSYSNGSPQSCVEVVGLPSGRVAVRNSNHRDAGTAIASRAAFGALCRAAATDGFVTAF